MIEGHFIMLAELEHAPKIDMRGDVFSLDSENRKAALLGPSAAPRARYHGRDYDWFPKNYSRLSL
jgi:hypothetical protein